MTILDPVEDQRRDQSRQRAVRILSLVLALTGLFCVFLFTKIVSPPAGRVNLGSVERFQPGTTTQIAVPRLDVSTTLQRRPDGMSDDPIFITHYADGSWRALLGWDSLTGCIVQPNADATEFRDACSSEVYDAQGNSRIPGSTLRLGHMPIAEENGELILLDEFVRD